MSLLITHTNVDGTMIDGTTRGDGTDEILKTHGWRWSRALDAWYVPQTRLVSSSARAQRVVAATASALEAAGFEVTIEADWGVPDDTLEARIDRQRERVAALEAKTGRKQSAEDAAWAREKAASDRLPWGGEPIKVGHHSEGPHRRAIERAHSAARRALEATRDAEATAERLDAARRHLAGLEAQRGRVTYTVDILAGATAVRDRWGWHTVVRVNRTTVTVKSGWGTGRVGFDRILEHRTAA